MTGSLGAFLFSRKFNSPGINGNESNSDLFIPLLARIIIKIRVN